MTTSEQGSLLARLRRYQQVLVMGGATAITVVVLAAGVIDVAASINAYLARMKEEVSIDVRGSLDLTTRTVATLRNSAQNIELAWQDAAADGQGGEPSFGQTGALRVQPDPDGPPLLVLRNNAPDGADKAWGYVGLAKKMAATTAVIAARNAGELAVYLYSPDRQTLVMSVLPWGGVAWQDKVTADRGALFAALTSSDGAPIAAPEGGWRNAASRGPRLQWLPPYQSPLTGRQAERIATQLWAANGEPIGTLVYEMPLGTLAASLPETSFAGTSMVLAADGSLVVARPGAPAAELQRLAGESVAAGLGKSAQTVFKNGYVLSAWPLAPSGRTLVHAQSWREIAAGVRPQVILAALTSAAIIALTWVLLLLVKWRVFVPAVRQSQRVFDSEQLSGTLVETAPVGLGLITVHSGQPLLRSPAMIETADRVVVDGPSLSYVLSRYYLQHERLAAGAAPPGSHSPSQGSLIKDDLTFHTRDGQRLDLSVSMVRARYQDEEVLVTAFTDVTAGKQLEQGLRVARQAADSANAAKSAFLAAMSHEIRTPLNAVLGNLELLAYSPLDDWQRDRLNIIRNASDGLLTVVSDVLDFSKIEAGELQLEDQEFDALALASHSLIVFAPVAAAKGLALAGELGEAVSVPLHGDPARLRQVINNLLSNAIKFTDRGQVTLRLSRDDETSRMLIEVEDTGIGMNAEQVSRLFQDFSQADSTINRRFGGTGLGLALSRRLAQAMGGRLDVHSQSGVGSRFTLRLPVRADTPVGETPHFDGQTVLLVVASPEWRSRLSRALMAWGLRVHGYPHPALITPDDAGDAQALIFWADRQTWHADDEDRLVQEASWVVDCAQDGPAQPAARGRIVNASVFGLQGLANGLRYALQGRPLSELRAQGMVLGKRLKVLVAEDNAVNRKLFEEQLALLGCVPTAVTDAQEALSCLERDTFDVLVTDLSMPGEDGFALARQVRQRWPAMPVMAATANVTPQQREEGERAGMARVLGKPLSLADLAQALSEIAGLPPLRREAVSDGSLLGGRPMADETRQAFVQSCLDGVQTLHQGLRNEDVPGLLAELHSLGGACAVFGLSDIAQRCTTLGRSLSAKGARACTDDIRELADALLGVARQAPSTLIDLADQIIALLDAGQEKTDAARLARLARTLRAGLDAQPLGRQDASGAMNIKRT
ncbi:ATP-binding protein [Achromobacter sp. AGC39]